MKTKGLKQNLNLNLNTVTIEDIFTCQEPGSELCRPESHTSDCLEEDPWTWSADHYISSSVPPETTSKHIKRMIQLTAEPFSS